jgi:hypothetical protein
LIDALDSITWKWTGDGAYSAKSAYKMQIMGSFTTFNANAIWKAQAEGKHRLFAWLLIQYKIQTADMLLQKNWPCNPICPLCDRAMETEAHLCLHCVFTREVWDLVVRWLDGLFRFLS